ncbi:MAG: hypothetical protein J6S60_04770 [Oscillospiraceae bacterium]|nr:hypothetical protein [Oscillospiraceae bacterium]
MATMIKIDKNGSKYFEEVCSCPKCGGSGTFEWLFVNGIAQRSGTCFQCGGSGKVLNKWVERTAEYQAKLDAERAAKVNEYAEANRMARANAWERAGLTRNGEGYILYGNTYKNRAAIQSAGGRWQANMKAYIAPERVELSGVKVMKVTADEICTGHGDIDCYKAMDIAETLN